MKVMFRGIAMLCVLQLSLFTGTAHSQERDNATVGNHKILYGLHVGFTENKVDTYSTSGGTLHAADAFHTGGFRLAVIGEVQLGRCFSLRVMPGMSLFKSNNVESVLAELPVDVKFHPIRMGNLRPYLASGIGYGYDYATLHDDGPNVIKPLNAHQLSYTCGLGVDWYTRLVRVGLEVNAGFGLLPLGDGGSNNSYFHSGPTFCIGLNIEA